MKKKLLIVATCMFGLVSGFYLVMEQTPKVVMGITMQQTYFKLEDIEEKSELIVSGTIISQETVPQIGGGRLKVVVDDAYTKTTFKINKVYNQEKGLHYKKGDIITVNEPAGLVEEDGQDRYFTSDGYRLMEANYEYFLFLADTPTEDEFTINGYQGKFNVDKKDKKETKYMLAEQKELQGRVKEEAMAKYLKE